MNPIYNLGIRLYTLGARIIACRNPKARKMLDGQAETIGRLCECLADDVHASSDGWIWIHAASLGEFEQGRPLIERLRRDRPDCHILLTFFSPSGYEVRKGYDKVDLVCYLPFDTPLRVSRFLDLVNPRMVVFVKYEFWGNYLEQLHARGIPVYLISSIFRERQPFFKWWGGVFRKMLTCFTHIYAQDERSRELLSGIGVDNVSVVGDTRLDRVTDIMKNATPIDALETVVGDGDEPVLIVGSSWEADEDVYMPWLRSHSGVRSVIAPHEFDAGRLERLLGRLGDGAMLLSRYEALCADAATGGSIGDVRHLVVDSFGKLSSLYRYGTVAYVGGGFGVGIHNINEAAVYGIPVVFGPNHSKFKEAADLISCKGAVSVNNTSELEKTLDAWLGDPVALKEAGDAAGEYISRNTGATDRIYTDLFTPRR